MQRNLLPVIALEEIPLTVKEIEAKWKQGIGINRTQEFMNLIKLCFSNNKPINFAACRSILYLLKWGMTNHQTVLGTLNTIAGETRDVSGLINFLAKAIIDCEKSDSYNYQRYMSHILVMNKNAVYSVLSVLDEVKVKVLVDKFRSVIHDLLFDTNNNRLLPWMKITERIDVHLHHTFLHWLKYTHPEDCSIAVMSIKNISLGNIQKCFILSSIIHHQMVMATNPHEAIDLLKFFIPHVGIQTNSIVVLTLCHGMEDYSKLHLTMIFDLCEWFLDNAALWCEVLWFMLAAILPLLKADVFTPTYHLKAEKLVDKINQKITSKTTNMNMADIKSLVLRYTIYRHNCIHESILLLRLIISFSNKKELLNSWLQKLLDNSPRRSIEILVTMYVLSGDVITRKNCLSVMSKWNSGNINLYCYLLKRENNPVLQYEILKILAARGDNKSGAVIFNQLKENIESEKHENSFTFCEELYYHTGISEDKNRSTLLEILKWGEDADYVQAAAMKTIALNLDTYCEDLIPLANKIINNSKNDKGTLSTAFAIDTISIMCEKGYLDASVLWDQFMRLVAADKHPAVQKSVCNFLSKIPLIIKRSEDSKQVLYRSARLLWHFATNPSFDRESAVRSLKEYDLEDFDTSFLSEQCKSHVKSTSITFIPGSCWLHLLCEDNALEIFIHLVNKISKKAKFRGNYSSLFHGIIESLKVLVKTFILNRESSERNSIIICLKVLCADWTNIPAGKDVNFLELLLQNSDAEIKGLSLYAVLNLYPMNDIAKIIFENFLQKKQYGTKEKSIMCLLPSNFLSKQRETNMEILFDGVYHGLCSEDIDYNSGESFSTKILEVFLLSTLDNTCPNMCRRIIMIIMVQVWIKVPFNDQMFNPITKFLAKAYGKPLLKTMPPCSSDYEMCMKYAHLSTEIAIDTKILYAFDLAVRVGLNHSRLQGDIIKCLIKVLKVIGSNNQERNIKWLIRLICTISMHPDNFLCQVLVHLASYLSETNIFMVKESLATSMDLFPLAIVKVSDLRRIPRNVMLTLNEIITQRQVHSTFIEVFKLGIMTLRDDRNVLFESVVKQVMEP